jgi:hypothetical protein
MIHKKGYQLTHCFLETKTQKIGSQIKEVDKVFPRGQSVIFVSFFRLLNFNKTDLELRTNGESLK